MRTTRFADLELSTLMLGGMQDFELRVPRILEHAEREHARFCSDAHRVAWHRARAQRMNSSVELADARGVTTQIRDAVKRPELRSPEVSRPCA